MGRIVHHGFDVAASEDLRYINDGYAIKDSIDACKASNGELFRECISFTGQRCLYTNLSWYCHDLLYCQECFNNCAYCFGCIGLKHKQYCIFNKQYTKEAYEELLRKILAHMEKTGELGEFFPIKYAPYAYNEAIVSEYYPLSEEQVKANGWQWKEKQIKEYQPQTYQVSTDITQVQEDICENILACHSCSKNYRIVKPELAFYKQLHLPIPTICPDCRHQERNSRKNSRMLWASTCANCAQPIETSYDPARGDLVYCETCYLKYKG